MDFPDKIQRRGTAQSRQPHRPLPFNRAGQVTLLITCFAGYYGTSFRNGRKIWFSAYCLYLSMRTQRGEAGNTPTLQDIQVWQAHLYIHTWIYKLGCVQLVIKRIKSMEEGMDGSTPAAKPFALCLGLFSLSMWAETQREVLVPFDVFNHPCSMACL